MKAPLTATIVAQLDIGSKPVLQIKDGKVVFAKTGEPNPSRTPYIVFDADQNAPVGFGVKIAQRTKSYIVQRRIDARVFKIKVGNVSDFTSLDQARLRARELVNEAKATGQNPVVRRRQLADVVVAANLTLPEVMALYRDQLTSRAQPAKGSSLNNFDLAARRLARPELGLATVPLGNLLDSRVVAAFDRLANSPRTRVANPGKYGTIRTTAEQTFRWAGRAVRFAMDAERRRSDQARTQPSLVVNPIDSLHIGEKFRAPKQLEEHYKVTGARNPMSTEDGTLGRFLDALMRRRRVLDKRTGCDYLLLTLLWGMRRSEAAPLRWLDLLSDSDRHTSSFVDMELRYVHLHDTKNRTTHDLPLGPIGYEILSQRLALRDQVPSHRRAWVFPARSAQARQGHYLDSKVLLGGIAGDAGLTRRNPIGEVVSAGRTHDLRRTFGLVAADTTASELMVKRLLNHRRFGNVTSRYVEWSDGHVASAMAKIQRAIILTSKEAATALLPVDPASNSLLIERHEPAQP